MCFSAVLSTTRVTASTSDMATLPVIGLISTNFQHKKIHIGTWTPPDHQTINQIDHVMVSKKKNEMDT